MHCVTELHLLEAFSSGSKQCSSWQSSPPAFPSGKPTRSWGKPVSLNSGQRAARQKLFLFGGFPEEAHRSGTEERNLGHCRSTQLTAARRLPGSLPGRPPSRPGSTQLLNKSKVILLREHKAGLCSWRQLFAWPSLTHHFLPWFKHFL